MKLLIVPAIFILWAFLFGACKSSSSGPKTFCDTSCLKDSIKFSGDHMLKPYVYISASNCQADTLLWSYNGMGVNRKVGLPDFLNTTVQLHKDYVRCFFKDTAYAWVLFNNCSNGRGYSLKLPFNKVNDIGRKSNNINNLDKKFSISDNLVAYTDRGNIYIEDMFTGKKAMMTFGEKLDIDYDAIHEYVDSVNVTNTRIWVKVKIKDNWKELEKNIVLE
ncbi:MAG: hypothetical protein IPP43_05850 [Chitinophagaceae bacterium]|nr:hypothetical protein [Chitinophagaceae bacterium]MBL0274226.1 hypothetical protein [Chitinophagaceae bacterium]